MKIFITGASGLLGSRVAEIAQRSGHSVYSGYLNHKPLTGKPIRVDVSNKRDVFGVVTKTRPDVIIHCAALTNVDKCEIERDLAKKVNIDGASFIAEAARYVDAYVVYLSTDYVFDGAKGRYKEEDRPNPINFYGYSKLLGEKVIEKIGERYLISRVSVIYGSRPTSGKINFALWLLDRLKNNQEVKVLVDQYVSPTLNTNLAEMLLEACERNLTGIYHMAGGDRVSRFEFAVKLAEVFGLNKILIKKASMSEMNWIAERPRDSSLDVSKAKKVLKVKPMNLSEALNVLKRELEIA